MRQASWNGPTDVKLQSGATVDFVADNRLIFDIGGNKYRVIVHVAYGFKRVLIKFVGTHAEYNRIRSGDRTMISRPIRTDAEYKEALAEIEQYFAHEPAEDTPEADQFDLLTLLIEAYEEQHHPIGPPHPVEMIRHRIEQRAIPRPILPTCWVRARARPRCSPRSAG